jgi:predicted AlkP superfamily phosphohydrolase/phosphomutase
MVIGLEGFDSNIYGNMRRSGELPVLDSIMKRQCRLGVPIGFGNDVFWRAVFGGSIPGGHTDYFRAKPQQGSYHRQSIHEPEGFGETQGFWLELASLGHQIAVLNAPEVKIQTARNLTWISQWLVHAPISSPKSSPPTMMNLLDQIPGIEKLKGVIDSGHVTRLEDLDATYNKVAQKQAQKRETYKQILRQGGWDCFFCDFDGAHDIAHKLWHFHDPRSQYYEKAPFDPVLEIYRETDKAIGQLAELAGDVPIGIVTGLGLHRMSSLNSMLGEILFRLEAHYSGQTPSSERHERLFIDVPNNPVSGAIRVNLKGRDPLGKVSSENYTDLISQLSSDLMSICSVDSGNSVIEQIIDVDDIFPGPYRSGLPDLMLYWAQGASDGPFYSEIIGDMDFVPDANMVLDYRSGDHNFDATILGNHLFFSNLTIEDGLPCQYVPKIIESLVKGKSFSMKKTEI